MLRRKLGKSISGLALDVSGVTAIEYTLIAALIAVAAVLVMIQIGTDVAAPFNTIAGNL
jgi:Flp pilus assembly pilin Flp